MARLEEQILINFLFIAQSAEVLSRELEGYNFYVCRPNFFKPRINYGLICLFVSNDNKLSMIGGATIFLLKRSIGINGILVESFEYLFLYKIKLKKNFFFDAEVL